MEYDQNKYRYRSITHENERKKIKNYKLIIDAIANNPGISQTGIAEITGISRTTVNNKMPELEEKGKVIQKTDEKNDQKYNYYLTEKEIKRPDFQGEIIFHLIFDEIKKVMFDERKKILKEIKDENQYRLFRYLGERIIDQEFYKGLEDVLNEQIENWENKEKKFLKNTKRLRNEDFFDSVNTEKIIKKYNRKKYAGEETRIHRSFEGTKNDFESMSILDHYPTYREELMDSSNSEISKEVKNDVRKYLLTKVPFGPLIIPRICFTSKLVVDELMRKMLDSNEYEDKEILKETIDLFMETITCKYIDEEISEESKKSIKNGIKKVFKMEPTERYKRYPIPKFVIKYPEDLKDELEKEYKDYEDVEGISTTDLNFNQVKEERGRLTTAYTNLDIASFVFTQKI